MSLTPIPMVDLGIQYQAIKSEIQNALNDVLDKTAFIMGPNVNAFEEEAADYLNVKHAMGCASGTDALHLALLALDIKPGDEVIAPSFTFAATAEAICYVGATPVFVDIDPTTLNLDTEKVALAINENTKAIIAVHLFGLPAHIDELKTAIGDRDIYLIEDCAQSFGATYKNKKTGSLADIACFSFFPSKNLGCYGDGGLVTTQNEDLATRVKLFRNHGSPVRYEHSVIGYNSRLDEIQAAILRVKLKHIDEYNKHRHHVAQQYTSKLVQLGVSTPVEEPEISRHVFHQYTILDSRRDSILDALQTKKIGCAIYYPKGLHLQEAFKPHIPPKTTLPMTEQTSSHCLSLPMFPELSDKQIKTVVDTIEQVIS